MSIFHNETYFSFFEVIYYVKNGTKKQTIQQDKGLFFTTIVIFNLFY